MTGQEPLCRSGDWRIHGRGLLFGKLAGRFWIPQHARGDREHGESVADYALQPSAGQLTTGGRSGD